MFYFAQKGHHKGKGKNKHHVHVVQAHPGHDVHVVSYKKVKKKGPPSWAPAHGYKHRYVYFPEHHCYYDNTKGHYIYRKGTVWVTSFNRPVFMINVNTTRKVELQIDNAPRPHIYFEQHIALYN